MRNPYHAVPGALGLRSGQAAGKLSPELKEQLGSTWDQGDSGDRYSGVDQISSMF